jgi:hypothetical protein
VQGPDECSPTLLHTHHDELYLGLAQLLSTVLHHEEVKNIQCSVLQALLQYKYGNIIYVNTAIQMPKLNIHHIPCAHINFLRSL